MIPEPDKSDFQSMFGHFSIFYMKELTRNWWNDKICNKSNISALEKSEAIHFIKPATDSSIRFVHFDIYKKDIIIGPPASFVKTWST